MSVLDDLLAVTIPVSDVLARIEVTVEQHEALRAAARVERLTWPSRNPVPQSTLLGVPVIIVDEPLEVPRLVYVKRGGS